MSAVTTTPLPTTVPTTTEPPVTLHMVHRDDILEGQVHGIPVQAICGHTFVPASGHATGAGGGKSRVCEACDTLWKLGVRTAPNRY